MDGLLRHPQRFQTKSSPELKCNHFLTPRWYNIPRRQCDSARFHYLVVWPFDKNVVMITRNHKISIKSTISGGVDEKIYKLPAYCRLYSVCPSCHQNISLLPSQFVVLRCYLRWWSSIRLFRNEFFSTVQH